MARIRIVPETRVAYTVFPGWQREARTQAHRQLVQGRQLAGPSSAVLAARERHREMSYPGTAAVGSPSSTVPRLRNAAGPPNVDGSYPDIRALRPEIVCFTTYIQKLR